MSDYTRAIHKYKKINCFYEILIPGICNSLIRFSVFSFTFSILDIMFTFNTVIASHHLLHSLFLLCSFEYTLSNIFHCLLFSHSLCMDRSLQSGFTETVLLA